MLDDLPKNLLFFNYVFCCVFFYAFLIRIHKDRLKSQKHLQKYKNKSTLPFFYPPYFDSRKAVINVIMANENPKINIFKLNFCTTNGTITVPITSNKKLYKKSLIFCFCLLVIIITLISIINVIFKFSKSSF